MHRMTIRLNILLSCAAAAALFLLLPGCEEKGPVEKAGEKVDDAVEKTGEVIEDAGDAVKDATTPD